MSPWVLLAIVAAPILVAITWRDRGEQHLSKPARKAHRWHERHAARLRWLAKKKGRA